MKGHMTVLILLAVNPGRSGGIQTNLIEYPNHPWIARRACSCLQSLKYLRPSEIPSEESNNCRGPNGRSSQQIDRFNGREIDFLNIS